MRAAGALLSPPQIRRALGMSVADGVLHAVMLGASESYLGALAVELGHGARALALLSALPLLAGSLVQLGSSLFLRWLGTSKRVAIVGASLQALSHVGLAYVAQAHERALMPLLLAKTLFWVSGAAIAPAWGAWMADLVAGEARERYFAWRSAAVHAGLVSSFLLCGALLERTTSHAQLDAFVVLFWVGGAARGLSVLCLWAQADRSRGAVWANTRAVERLLQALREGEWRTPLYMAGLMFGVHLAVPFFTPYMLRELALDYATFVTLTATSIVAKACMFPLCHRLTARHGLRAVLFASGVGVSAMPALWALATTTTHLYGIEVLGGVTWAGLEYASFQLILRSAGEDLSVEMLAISGSITGAAALLGAYVGGLVLEAHALSYAGVFGLSSVARALSLTILLVAMPNLKLHGTLLAVVTRLFSVRPNAGALQRAVVVDEKERDD